MKRRDFIQKTGIGLAGVFGSFALRPFGVPLFANSRERPNILFITTDYQAGEDIPLFGSPFLRMPNIDRLCNEGVVFQRHYCTASISIPSRYTLITGQYPHSHGAHDNTGAWVPQGSPLFMEQLAQGGYHLTGVGKMHFNPWDRMAGFHERIIADRKGNSEYDSGHMDDYARFLAQHNLNRMSYLRKQWLSDIFGVYDWPFADEFHIDHYVGEQTVRAIEQADSNRPWFMWSSFNGPHNPWDPPARFSDRYKRMDLPEARAVAGELQTKPPDHTRLRYNYTRDVVDRLDQAGPEESKELINRLRAGHFGGLSFIDEQIGRIMDALEASGQADNTIVIFSSDHGCELGDHHNIHKGNFYERSARVPMIVWSPHRYSPRKVDTYSSHVDLFPTFLSMAGLGISRDLGQKLEGFDLTPVIKGDDDYSQQQAFNEIRGGTNIVTDDWKFSIYPSDGSGELYDRKNDPDELINLFDNSDYQDIRRQLTERLVAFYPPLAGQVEQMSSPVFVERDIYRWESGKHILPADAPYQAGKTLRVNANINSNGDTWGSGPLMAAYISGVHGYSLYIRDGYLACGFRRWGRDTLVLSPSRLPEGSLRVGLSVSRDGIIRLMVDGEPISSGKVEGLIPVQEGHDRVMPPHIFIGYSPAWVNPIGGYDNDQDITGQISFVELQLNS